MSVHLTRRAALSALAVAGSLPLVAARAATLGAGPDLAIFDSRIPESRTFATQMAQQGARLFDLADQDQSHWRAARDGFGLSQRSTVAGMTRWSDWIALSSLLGERGHRPVALEQVKGASHAALFRWDVR